MEQGAREVTGDLLWPYREGHEVLDMGRALNAQVRVGDAVPWAGSRDGLTTRGVSIHRHGIMHSGKAAVRSGMGGRAQLEMSGPEEPQLPSE